MRPIDADALKETKYVYHDNGEVGERLYISFDEIDNAPTVDAVPVVRCKDCKYWDKDEPFGGSDLCECKAHGGYFLANDYCSDGERREDDAKESP